MRQEVGRRDVFFRQEVVARDGLALGLEQSNRGRVARAVDATLADVDALVAECVVRVRVDELRALVDDVVDGADRAIDTARVDVGR